MSISQENIDRSMFDKLPDSEKQLNEIVRPSLSYGQDAWRRLKKNPYAISGLVYVVFITLVAIFAGQLTPYNYFSQNLQAANIGPTASHWFGVDHFGRDILTRVIFGARISMIVAYASTLIILTVGVLYGAISAYVGGRTDNIMMRILDVLSGIPSLLYLILLMVTLGPGLLSIIIAMGMTGWIGMARMVRAEVFKIKEQEYVLASRALGTSKMKTMFKHLLPNSMGVILVNLTFAVPTAIFSEAFLSFLGLGVSAPQASWGMLASEAVGVFMTYPYQLFFPSLAICLTILAFNFLGDGLRDALDPQMRK